MYNTRPGLLIGFHGCDRARQEKLLADSAIIPVSNKPYDWLGHGMYFWENNYDRALQWAKDNRTRGGEVKEPAVIGAVIDLSYCCDLLDSGFIELIGRYNQIMVNDYKTIGKPLPFNKDAATDQNKDRLMRFLDCATIEFMHEFIRKAAARNIETVGYTSFKLFDSVRGVFLEGGEAYPGAGICAKSHIQICIRNANCIKGFFVKRDEIDFFQSEISRGKI